MLLNQSSMRFIQNIIAVYQNMVEDILDNISQIDKIAIQTNLLALNATIETIHASELLESFEKIVGSNLLIQAKILSKILEHDPDFINQDGAKLAKECGIEEFYITDAEGKIVFTNRNNKQDTIINKPEMVKLIGDPGAEVVLPSSSSIVDEPRYKVVGVGRTDMPGLIQLAVHFIKPKGQEAIDGFGVVANEAKRLSDMSNEVSDKLNLEAKELVNKIDKLKHLSDSLENREVTKSDIKQIDEQIDLISQSFKSILYLLTDLTNIARQTSLLGVRASIEAANTINEKLEFDTLLNIHMIIEAKLSAILLERTPNITSEELTEIAEYCRIGEYWITDDRGVVELTNVQGGIGFAFTNEGQTAPYMRILKNPDLVVSQPPAERDIDGKVYKFVAVGRRDKPGILQIGNPSKLYGENTAKGFHEVAKQIKYLAEQSMSTTGEIVDLIEEMKKNTDKAVSFLASI
ncbi:MAG: hypothetical protein GX076_08360 [Clostridiales bacterium]|nr:hypothetical protein [Clostridiales bacterium]